MDEERRQLLIEIEKILSRVYNQFSATMHGGYPEEGRFFNYPVRFIKKDGVVRKFKGISDYVRGPMSLLDDEELLSGHYALGANEMPIYKNIERVLVYLESEFEMTRKEKKEKSK